MHDQAKGRAKKKKTKSWTPVKVFVANGKSLEHGEIYEVEGKISKSGMCLTACVPWDPTGRVHAFFKPDWHEKRKDAVAKACELRDAKVEEFQVEVERLKALTF